MPKLEKIKNFFLSTNFALVAFSAYVGKMVIVGTGFAEALALIPLSCLYGYSLYLNSKKVEPLSLQVSKELENIKSHVSALKVEKAINKKNVKYF